MKKKDDYLKKFYDQLRVLNSILVDSMESGLGVKVTLRTSTFLVVTIYKDQTMGEVVETQNIEMPNILQSNVESCLFQIEDSIKKLGVKIHVEG